MSVRARLRLKDQSQEGSFICSETKNGPEETQRERLMVKVFKQKTSEPETFKGAQSDSWIRKQKIQRGRTEKAIENAGEMW